jgi:thiol:disulfide interchange protein
MQKILLTLAALVSASISPLHAEFRNWTNLEGVKIEAELVEANGDNVTLRLRNGKLTTFATAKLSLADQTLIKEKNTTAPIETKPAVESDRKARWLAKMDKAQEQSKATGLPILALFTGTSWCPSCIKLEAQVFSKSEFKAFADKNLVLLKLDYGPGGDPSNKKDEALAKEFGVTGYPTYFLLDTAGKRLASGGFNEKLDPKVFASWVTSMVPKP